MAGYSGTPLSKKLGIKPGTAIHAIDAPSVDVVHLFATTASTLRRTLPRLRKQMRADAMVWVSWPKKAAKIKTDVTEDVIRAVALPSGLVDVKVCAVDDVWSGLKLVIRRGLRA